MFKKVRLFFSILTGATVLIMTSQTTKAETTHLILDTTKGQIEIELKSDLAPNHVARITELAAEGFYDGIIFHRVIPGFMAQTGDPTGTGMGGSGQKIDAEFTDYQYIEGTVGMARSMNPDSGDSQFFICFDGCVVPLLPIYFFHDIGCDASNEIFISVSPSIFIL